MYDDPKAYDDYFINQLSELLTGYGEVDMLWFDGCGSEGHTYNLPRIVAEIRRMQPELLIFNMADPAYRWVGNEAGYAPMPTWNTAKSVPFSINASEEEKLARGQPAWLPVECDFRMRDLRWFYDEAEAGTIKSIEELMGVYYYSVGRGCNLLLNIGPDRRGLLPDTEARRLLEFGEEIRRRFAQPLATLADFARSGNKWEIEFSKPQLIDHLVAQEYLRDGERVRRFRVTALVGPHRKQAILVFEGYNIGHKAICSFPAIRCYSITLEVTENDGAVDLAALQVYSNRTT